MKRLPASIHRSIDMLAVICFLGVPMLVGLAGTPALVSYALAAIHIIVTLSTKFPDTGHRPIALRVHGGIELVIGVVLIALPFLTGWDRTARIYYVTIGALLLVVWVASNYGRQYGAERNQKARI